MHDETQQGGEAELKCCNRSEKWTNATPLSYLSRLENVLFLLKELQPMLVSVHLYACVHVCACVCRRGMSQECFFVRRSLNFRAACLSACNYADFIMPPLGGCGGGCDSC